MRLLTSNIIKTHFTKPLALYSQSKFVMSTAVEFSTPRLVAKKVLAKSQGEGDGAVVRRSIGR